MQLKLYKKSTLLLCLVVLADVVSIALMLIYREKWAPYKVPVIAAFVLFLFLLSTCYSWYDLNADQNLIRKRVSNGDVALAKIKDGSFVRFG
ncbi:MAG: hypothetical protein IJI44_05040, partial [Erysipelotrichaceae bacterium]|nr:hypothetical protein [Erysipelotrichaceae bacterium]